MMLSTSGSFKPATGAIFPKVQWCWRTPNFYGVVKAGIGVMAGMVNAVDQCWPQVAAGRFQPVTCGAIGIEQLFAALGHGATGGPRRRTVFFEPVVAGTVVTLAPNH